MESINSSGIASFHKASISEIFGGTKTAPQTCVYSLHWDHSRKAVALLTVTVTLGSVIPLLGLTQYPRGAAVFALKHIFLSIGFHNLRSVVATFVKEHFNLRSVGGLRTIICPFSTMAPEADAIKETEQGRHTPTVAVGWLRTGDYGGNGSAELCDPPAALGLTMDSTPPAAAV